MGPKDEESRIMILIGVLLTLLSATVGVRMIQTADEFRKELIMEDCHENSSSKEEFDLCVKEYLEKLED